MKIFSGVQPTGNLHIGNYLGAIKQWAELQNGNEAIYCVVDEHAITVPQDPEKLREATLNAAITVIAAGVDPNSSIIFIQSHVPAHTELGWILNTFTPMGELERMTQYKDKKEKSTFAGLFNYPTLMAADILLYKTEAVPVGEDQVQHIELTRSLAERFNNRFGETFVIPEAKLVKKVARIMSLTDPTKKMSKSDELDKSRVNLLDSKDEIVTKIKSAVTDSGSEIAYNPDEKPAITNLLNIYSAFSGKEISSLENEFSGKTYSQFKNELADVVATGLEPFQQRYRELQNEKTSILEILKNGAEKAASLAEPTLRTTQEKVGFLI